MNQADSIRVDTIAHQKTPEAHHSLLKTAVTPEGMIANSRVSQDHPHWVAGILLICFVLLAWGRLFSRRRLDMIFRAVFAKNYANQLIREGNLFNERIGLVLFLIYLMVLSLFVYLAIPLITKATLPLSGGILYLLIIGFFIGLWFLKVIIVKTLSRLFNTSEHSRELLANMYLFNLFAGIILLPLVSCMAFAHLEIFFYISLILIGLIYTFRIFREAIIGFMVIKFSVFHLLLYLCTLEILPLIVLAKILTRNMVL
jgi:hypothetical protein